MKNLFKNFLASILVGISILASSFAGDLHLGFSVATGYQKTLRASMSATQTTIPVTSLTLTDGTVLTSSTFPGKIFLMVDPGKPTRQEIIMCTGIDDVNINFDPCVRGLAFSGTSTASVPGNRRTHNAGAIVTMSNVHYVYDELTDKDSNETINGQKTFPDLVTFGTIPLIPTTTPTSSNQVASKMYVDNVIAAGAPDGTESVKGLWEGATLAELLASAINGGTGAGLLVQSKYVTSTFPGATGGYVVAVRSDGKLDSSLGGTALSFSTLNSAGLVVQNPASATSTPTINSIPLTNASTTDLNRWIQAYERQYTAGEPINASATPTAVYLSQIDGKVYKASSNFTSSTFRFIGFVAKSQNVTTSDSVWVTGGNGAVITGFTGLTTGDDLYISTTGTIANSGGTIPWKIAKAVSTTAIMIELAPKRYVGTYSNNLGNNTAGATVTTTIDVGFKPKKITFLVNAGHASDSTILSKFEVGTAAPDSTNNPFWYEGTTYGYVRDDLNSTLADDSTYLISVSSAANTHSRLSVLSVTQSAVSFVWGYRTQSNGNTYDQAWINALYIIEE